MLCGAEVGWGGFRGERSAARENERSAGKCLVITLGGILGSAFSQLQTAAITYNNAPLLSVINKGSSVAVKADVEYHFCTHIFE